MRSVMSHKFSNVPSADIQRSSFNRTHAHKTTFDAGYLIPFYVDEVLPGDTFSMTATLFSRMATPVFPIMDNLFMDTFFFFVPCRLLWDSWQKFMGERENPEDSIDYLVPQYVYGADPIVGRVGDYMGIPSGTGRNAGLSVNALPLRAYYLIWNEWFRDENLQNKASFRRSDANDNAGTLNSLNLMRRGKRHDYFTSALPWPQKGPGVEIPIAGSNIPVKTSASPLYTGTNINPMIMRNVIDGSISPVGSLSIFSAGKTVSVPTSVTSTNPQVYPSNLYIDPTAITATINSLRQAFQLQKFYERDARGGTRYIEILRSHFGVVSPDARLQRPEYLGGHSQPVNINPVMQTSSTDTTSPQGNLAAYAVTSQQCGFSKSFVEHGYVIGLVSVRADLTYQQGLNRMWSRRSRYDFYWPVFAHLGEQVVYNKEIYCDNTSASNDGAFGYQERFAEYRYKPSLITGYFRSGLSGSLDVWHLSQYFSTLPLLNGTFIQDNPPISRVVAVPSQPQFIFDSYIRLKCARPMPVYSVPGLIDHF